MSATVVKCNTCNIVISEVLAFIQNQADVMNEESIIRLCATAFSVEEIETAKNLMFQSVQTSEKNVKRKGKTEGKIQRDLQDIISIVKCTSTELIPIFVARDLRKLPPVTYDHIDCTRLLKDINMLKDQVQDTREQYATVEQLNVLKLELFNLKQASLVDGFQQNNYVNMNRGSRNLRRYENSENNSGPFGILNISQEIINSPTKRVGEKTADHNGGSMTQRQTSSMKKISPFLSRTARRHEAIPHEEPIAPEVDSSASSPRPTMSEPRAPDSAARMTHNSLNKSYSQVARDGSEFNNKTDEQWIMVQKKRHKNRFVGTQGQSKDSTGNFKAADVKIPLFINNVDKKSSATDITDYIMKKTNVLVNLVEIKMKRPKPYNAYKVFVPKHKIQMFLDENMWPEGINFRRFIYFNERRSPNRVLNNGSQSKE